MPSVILLNAKCYLPNALFVIVTCILKNDVEKVPRKLDHQRKNQT